MSTLNLNDLPSKNRRINEALWFADRHAKDVAEFTRALIYLEREYKDIKEHRTGFEIERKALIDKINRAKVHRFLAISHVFSILHEIEMEQLHKYKIQGA